MSESSFCPYWSPIPSSTVTREPEPATPRFHAHGGPFVQPVQNRYDNYTHPDTYRHSNDGAVNQHREYTHPPDHVSMHPPHPPTQRHYPVFQYPYQYQYQYPSTYPYQGTQPPLPRQPAFSPNRPADAPSEVSWFSGAGHMPALPSHSMMRVIPVSPPLHLHGSQPNTVPSQPLWPLVQEQGYGATAEPPPVASPSEHAFDLPTPGPLPDRSHPAQPLVPRTSQQDMRTHHGNSSNNNNSRSFRSANGPGLAPEAYNSARVAMLRYDHMTQFLSRTARSPEVDEGLSRVPPSLRARRHPIPPRAHDPNFATSQQVQELKDKLPRRVLGQLSLGTSPTCDICAKDYSRTCVPASEESEIAVELPCGHYFGEFCISEWFDTCKKYKNKVTCPMCRKQLLEPSSRYNSSLFFRALARGGDPALQEMMINELRQGLRDA